MTTPVRQVDHGRLRWCVPGALGVPECYRTRRQALLGQRRRAQEVGSAVRRLLLFCDQVTATLKRLQKYERPL